MGMHCLTMRRGNIPQQNGDPIMATSEKSLPSEKEIKSIIDNLLAKEQDFTTPKSKMVFLNKLHKYQKMLLALQDGHPENWPQYAMTSSNSLA